MILMLTGKPLWTLQAVKALFKLHMQNYVRRCRIVLILIIEDEEAISDLIAMNLKLVGYNYKQVYDSDAAISAVKGIKPDLILLDVMIPGVDGFTLIKDRHFNGIPIIFVTAKDTLTDKVKGLKLGADDYIVKPFDSIELLARIEAVMRRIRPDRTFEINNIIVKLDERVVKAGGVEVQLTNMEFKLLEVLIINRNLALSREKLLELVWGYDYLGDARTVDVHITKLRKKLNLENDIKTVYKMGYRLEV